MFSKPAAPALPSRPLRGPRRGPNGPRPVEGGVAELVVPGLLLGVREDVVGVLDLLEFRLGRLVAGVGVGVVLPGERSVRLLDLLGAWRRGRRPGPRNSRGRPSRSLGPGEIAESDGSGSELPRSTGPIRGITSIASAVSRNRTPAGEADASHRPGVDRTARIRGLSLRRQRPDPAHRAGLTRPHARRLVIIHERLGALGPADRPRFRPLADPLVGDPVGADAGPGRLASACPIVVIDLDGRPVQGLEDLDAGLRGRADGPGPGPRPDRSARGSRRLARELGATLVLAGVVVPPEVGGLLHRWLPLARQRAEADGWSAAPPARARALGAPEPVPDRDPHLADLTPESTSPPRSPPLIQGIRLDVRQEDHQPHRARRARRPQGGQGPRPPPRPRRPRDDQGHPDRRGLGRPHGQPDHPRLPAQGQDRGGRPRGPDARLGDRADLHDQHDRRRPGQGRHGEGRHPRRQERDRRRVGQGRGGQVDDGRGDRLWAASLRLEGRPDGRRRLRPVDPPPRRRHGPADGDGRADPCRSRPTASS